MQGANSYHIHLQELEHIKQQHLLRHFQQMAIIIGKHYHYAFQIIKHIHLIAPNRERKVTPFVDVLQQMLKRKMLFAFGSIARRGEDVGYSIKKGCILLAIFLQRKMIGQTVSSWMSINQRRSSIQIPSEKQLFLIIKLSNLNKIVVYVKIQAFRCIIKHYQLRKQEARKAKLIKMASIFNNYSSRMLIDAFISIKRPRIVSKVKQDDEQDSENIFIQSYKSMAVSLLRPQTTSKSLRQIKKQAAMRDLSHILSLRQQSTLRGCLSDLLCFQNHRFTAASLAVLRRQIAILQQQYESCE